MGNPLLSTRRGLFQEALNAGHSREELAGLTTGSQKKLNWKGKCGHTWLAKVSSRCRSKTPTGCPYCAGTKVLAGFNDLAFKNESLALEWHPTKNTDLLPTQVTASSKTIVWWLGRCGHEWEAEVGSRNSGRGCRYCSGNAVLKGFNDIATTHPQIAKRISPNSPISGAQISFGSHRKPLWRFGCEHDFDAEVASVIRGAKCPYCSGHRLLPGFNDLQSRYSKLAREWHPTKNGGLLTTEVSFGSHRKVWWFKESCQHEWQAPISNRTSNGHGCSICAGKVVILGENDLASTFPQLLEDWDYEKNEFQPTEVTWGTRKNVYFTCSLGHSWRSNPATRVNRRLGCPYCSKRKLLVGFNDFSVECEYAFSQWDWEKNGKEKPWDYLPGSAKKFWFRCEKGHCWRASLFSRYHNASDCPACADNGFNPDKPGTVYFLRNDELRSFKVGITNTQAKTDRIGQFESRGWKVVSRWQFVKGHDAYETEQRFFIWLRSDVGLGPSCSKADLQGMRGYTETFTQGVLRETTVVAKIEEFSLSLK